MAWGSLPRSSDKTAAPARDEPTAATPPAQHGAGTLRATIQAAGHPNPTVQHPRTIPPAVYCRAPARQRDTRSCAAAHAVMQPSRCRSTGTHRSSLANSAPPTLQTATRRPPGWDAPRLGHREPSRLRAQPASKPDPSRDELPSECARRRRGRYRGLAASRSTPCHPARRRATGATNPTMPSPPASRLATRSDLQRSELQRSDVQRSACRGSEFRTSELGRPDVLGSNFRGSEFQRLGLQKSDVR